MACIHDKFSTSTGKKNISSKQIWDHLHELYNMQALVGISSIIFTTLGNFINWLILLMKFVTFVNSFAIFTNFKILKSPDVNSILALIKVDLYFDLS